MAFQGLCAVVNATLSQRRGREEYETSYPDPYQHVPTARLCRPGVDIAWR